MWNPTTKLVGLSTRQIAELPVLKGEPPFRARQLSSWVYARGASTFAGMTDLSRALRERLGRSCSLELPEVLARDRSRDGTTEKFLLRLDDASQIESVLIRSRQRLTVCISTQVGCAFGCRFCATGAMKLTRNLTAHEIVSQLMVVRRALGDQSPSGQFNLVFMGMGEPLANFEALVQALGVLNEDHGLAVGRRRMTVSTVGLAPEIRRLSTVPVAGRLALSLNATTDEVRSRLMPINRTYPIGRVLPEVKRYREKTGQRTTLEYVLIRGFNDSIEDARRLARYGREFDCTLNLIVLNPHSLTQLRPSPPEVVRRFHDALLPIAPAVTLRESRGEDIRAACGQLSTVYSEKAHTVKPAERSRRASKN